MEAFGDRLARNGGGTAVLTADAGLASVIVSVNAAAASAPGTLAMAGYVEAADFAGLVEELSRTVDYLQILAAGAVDRTRTKAITAAAATRTTRDWVTGWDNGVETLNETDAAWPAGTTAGNPGPPPGAPGPFRGHRPMTAAKTPPNSCASGSGSGAAKPSAASTSPTPSCPPPPSPETPSHQ
ncbi:hypothetical protein [Pseudarthrobacter raffinosi]|uniref:hypothetical protein n=1 Tax=Pseudarthrobacter raffinosi TaxID=2953651 RepID=UPI00208E3E37|nr:MULTISPECIES: hypothetical protein [unclassified Pseudarthrobacter]MCO4252316.1 hypothetical protein [Pseudarthrobacter sp. MDT3-9]MCO4263220.1 hypothetical protein [Pseudarthrobacter sp. MDT3-26]